MRNAYFALLGMACTLHGSSSGVLVESTAGTRMMGNDGQEWKLVPGEHAPVLDNAVGVSVQVHGTRLGRRMWVREWTITDGGDGSAPFVGVLRRFGSQWLIDDLNSGATVALVEESLGELGAHEGHLVMVSGYVVGAHRVNVVRWSLLD